MTAYDNPEKSFLIVGIGASAGGLDALQRFIAVLPKDFDFALVFIQHLSAKHKSLLPELLSARRPSLVIQEITDGLKIQAGRLYLAPPGREVRLRNSFFQTTVHTEGLIHLAIDEFLSSLAEDAGERSIAVIFSGAGTDGARGCQAVRSVGGTVFVQDPETAEFNSMPLAAISTGLADAVLSPEKIAGELLKLQGPGEADAIRECAVSAEEYDSFFRLLQEKTGGRFNHYKKSVVTRRINRRMSLRGLSTVKDYLGLISANDSEAANLASDLMIGVTSFFRDRVAWKALNLEAVRKIAAENTDLPIRVWTPASSTGEEAYSIAMMFLHELALAGKKRDVQVFATDVNDRALERAREGKYPASIAADVAREYIQKYFTPTEDGNFLVINKDVRETVVFARQDLLTDPPFSKLDLIICRNFMIYLEPEAQEKCITLFHYALKEGGFLFLGNAETVGKKSRLFQSIGHKQCRVYRKLETKHASRLPISVPYAAERSAQQASKQAQFAEQRRSFTEIVQGKLLEEYAPASVAIDQNYEIIYHNGPTNKYLLQPRGVPTQNLLELLPENLRSRIRGALYRSSREEKPVAIRTSVAGDDNKKRQISLRITKAAENLFIVVFQEKGAPSKEEAGEACDATVIEETAIHQLESELSATRHDLQSHIEQLKSLNEEAQSSNEELQAANEELETSREELQSLNEELITVNSQLQGKIEEQETTNNDLNNFLASANIPTIFLDTHFRVKRFTPAMLKLIKLLPSDVGRPIVDMSQENLGPDLTSEAQAVLESLVPARQELELDGAWYVRTTLPYRTEDNRIEGVVITYNDVTALKKSEERTRHLASFPELSPNPICEVHSSGKIDFCNPATVKILASLGMDTEDLTVFVPEDMDDILRDLEKKKEVSLYREKEIRGLVFGMTVHLAPQFNVVRIYAFDITERKRAEEALRNNEKRLNRSQAIAHLGSWELDLVNNMLTWSDEVYRIFGLHPQEFGASYETFLDAIHPGDRAAVDAAYSGSIRDGKDTYEIEHRVVRKATGEVRYVHEKCEHFRDETGRIVRSVGMVHDITERKKAEEAQGRLSAIVASAEDAIISKDLNGVIQTWNVGAEMIFGYTAEEAIGRNISLLVPSGHADEVPDILRRLSQGEHIENFETVRMRKDGTVIPVSLNFSAIRDSSGKVIGASKIAHDITERKRAVEALLRLNKALKALSDGSQAIVRAKDEPEYLNDVCRIIVEDCGYSMTWIGFAENDSAKSVRPVAHSGFEEGYLETLKLTWADTVRGRGPTGTAIRTGNVAVCRNMLTDPAFTPWREEAIKRGYASSIVLPLRAADRVFGAISMYSKEADPFTEDEIRLLTELTDNVAYGIEILRIRAAQKQAEEALRKSEEQFRTLSNSIPNLAWWANADGSITWYNRRWYEYTGTTPEQMEGWGWQSVHDPKALPKVLERWQASIATGEPLEMEFSLRGADGVFRSFLTRVMPVKDSSSLVLRWFGTNTDISALKQAEEALRLSEEKFSLAFANNPAAIAMSRLEDGLFLDVNETWVAVTGYGRDEAIGRSARQLPIWPTAEAAARFVQELREKGVVRGWEQDFRKKSGEVFVTQLSAQSLTVRNEQVILSTLLDITERKRAEEMLRESEAKYHSLFDNMINGFAFHQIVVDEAGKPVDYIFREVNSAFEKLTGLNAADIQNKNATQVLPGIEKDPADWIGVYGKVALAGEEIRFEQYAETLGKWYSVMAYSPRRNYFATVFEDITERKQAEAALKKSEEQYRTLFETMTEGFSLDEIILDDAGKPVDLRCLSVNPAFEHYTGLKAEDIVGRTVRELFPEAEPVWFERYGKVVLTGEPAHFEERFGPLNKWFEVSVYRTDPGRFAVVFFDITERKKAEVDVLKLSEDMAVRNLELDTLNKELEAFIYSVSHDLRAPLRSMTGFAKILREDYEDKLDNQAKDYLTRIFNGSTKMTQLINDLLHLSKLSRQEVDRRDIDLSKLAEAEIHNLREAEHGRNVEVLIAQGVRASVDSNLMRIVMTNLLDNAWKFTSKTESATIEFGAMNREGTTVYFVRDNGAGFDPAFSGKMFGPFQRLHLENEFAGTGIGLAIVDRIIRRHGGKVWAEGEVGKGATVFFTLG